MLIKLALGISFVLLAVAAGLFYLHLASVNNFFIVRFDGLRGMTFLGGRMDVLGLLLTGSAISLVNLSLSIVLSKRDRFLANLVSFSTLFLDLLILISVGVIINVN